MKPRPPHCAYAAFEQVVAVVVGVLASATHCESFGAGVSVCCLLDVCGCGSKIKTDFRLTVVVLFDTSGPRDTWKKERASHQRCRYVQREDPTCSKSVHRRSSFRHIGSTAGRR